jgi:hypothetical protein
VVGVVAIAAIAAYLFGRRRSQAGNDDDAPPPAATPSEPNDP